MTFGFSSEIKSKIQVTEEGQTDASLIVVFLRNLAVNSER